MEYKPQPQWQDSVSQHRQHVKTKPRLIIHGGAGNIGLSMPPEKYEGYKTALLTIIASTNKYMNTPKPKDDTPGTETGVARLPSALDVATFAMTQLEDNPLFNSAKGAVFTRDGLNEHEASLMVTRGHAKRAIAVAGLQRVRNPILLCKEMLERGEKDLWGKTDLGWAAATAAARDGDVTAQLDVPSAQGHTLVHGQAAETLAQHYGVSLVSPEYFFTQNRWDEHIRALEREKKGKEQANVAAQAGHTEDCPALATWSADEYLPQGTCGVVAMDEDGTICVATSTGGMTNKLTGRIGDTPSVGAGFWAEEWNDENNGYHSQQASTALPASLADWSVNDVRQALGRQTGVTELSSSLRSMLVSCLPTVIPLSMQYQPIPSSGTAQQHHHHHRDLKTTRAAALSGTGNGDSFLRIAAVRTVASIARWGGHSTASALRQVAGPGGDLQKSAQDRWGKTGEGEGGMIGIESVVTRDERTGEVVKVTSEIVHEHNCNGMFRAWVDDDGRGKFQIWHGKGPDNQKARRSATDVRLP
ncbi:nucleophile aminohydrolase [Microdochium bolleyi]|uniref:Nucleophile aminohydrolase n=1 Tax=Microdochium bolleyi TaxID=196109 RepID=A0A136IU02_9PEZI|nr:nucleophile aminohydrolase [Microdochium bolleyi]